MQFYVIPERVSSLLKKAHRTTDDLLRASSYDQNELYHLATEGGPTRNMDILSTFCDVLDCSMMDFAKTKEEDGDDESDYQKLRQQEALPLDHDISHFSD